MFIVQFNLQLHNPHQAQPKAARPHRHLHQTRPAKVHRVLISHRCRLMCHPLALFPPHQVDMIYFMNVLQNQ